MSRAPVLLVVLAGACCAPALAQPAQRYDEIAETTFVLHRCNELTAERRAWLRRRLDDALPALAWTAAQRDEHDAALTQDLARRYSKVAKVRCDETARRVDLERRADGAAPR